MAVNMFVLTELLRSDDDDSDLGIIQASSTSHQELFKTILATSTFRHKKSRIVEYVETVLPSYTIDDFKDRFRLDRETFDKLVCDITPLMVNKKTIPSVNSISIEVKMLIFVKYLSTQLTFQNLADMFGVCETSVHSIIHRVSTLMSEQLLPILIKWPVGERIKKTVDGFADISRFSGVIRAVDGSHIAIRTPTECPENYINRKAFPSLILQAVCDSNLAFTDVYCGWPGSVHDARVFKNSPLLARMNQTSEEMVLSYIHLIGDAAYGLTPWMMVPYKDYGNLNKGQKRYNYVHSSTRMCIERAFGALKGRFRRLKLIDLADISCIVHVILSCCALHQLCIQSDDDHLAYIEEGIDENEEVNNFQNFLNSSTDAEVKRNSIKELLSN